MEGRDYGDEPEPISDEDFDQISKSSDLIDEEGDSAPPFDEDEY